MLVRFDKTALLESHKDKPIGVEGDHSDTGGKVSEADKIVSSTKQRIAEGGTPALGVSASNSGRGHDPIPISESEKFKPTALQGTVEEEPGTTDETDAPEVTTDAIPNRNSTTTDSSVGGSSPDKSKDS
jgi:protein phosphatase PTC1